MRAGLERALLGVARPGPLVRRTRQRCVRGPGKPPKVRMVELISGVDFFLCERLWHGAYLCPTM